MAVTFEFSGHALQRMFEREITIEAVKTAVVSGEVIAEYPDDRPLASRLILWRSGLEVLHVVAAFDSALQCEIIISVYRPDPALWNEDMRTRR
ncbi:MAG: DUF4258 domain-containing protein [Turneriella sp.]